MNEDAESRPSPALAPAPVVRTSSGPDASAVAATDAAPQSDGLPAAAFPPLPPPPPPPPPPRRRSPLAWIIVLAALLIVVIVGGALLFLQLGRTSAALDDANDRIQQQQDQLRQQQDLLDQKETFGQAMNHLMQVVARFDGIPTATVVPIDSYQRSADLAWTRREDADAMAALTTAVGEDAAKLQARLDAAAAQRATNASGTLGEAIIDERGEGFVATVYDDARAICGVDDAIGCVTSDDPTTVHLDAAGFRQPSTDNWGRTLVADHEFAHVLQFTNPGPTETALGAFDGDVEFMADCYALTLTNGWTLHHTVTRGGWIYTVDYGYGRVCDAGQRDVIRQWIGELGFRYTPITQQ